MSETSVSDQELDVRGLRKPDKHPTIFRAYDDLAVGGSFVLVNNHDPVHLRDEFDLDHPGSYDWEYLTGEPGVWRIRITKRASTPLPHILCDPAATIDNQSDATGAVWNLPMRQRDLDANVIHLPAGAGIDSHAGPDCDVLLLVVHGSGQLGTERDTVELHSGALVWLPRRSIRRFTAGPDGLGYLTVHQRRRSLVIDAHPR